MQNGRGTAAGLRLLALRVGAGSMLLYGHGWGKLTHFSERAAKFSDPIGLGSQNGLALVVFAEVFCAAAIALGLFTRLAAIPPIVAMSVAFFIHHAADPFGKKELALLYLVVFASIALMGAGPYSIDALLARRRNGRG